MSTKVKGTQSAPKPQQYVVRKGGVIENAPPKSPPPKMEPAVSKPKK